MDYSVIILSVAIILLAISVCALDRKIRALNDICMSHLCQSADKPDDKGKDNGLQDYQCK